MEEIGYFIIDNISNNLEVHHSVEQPYSNMNLDDICEGLFKILDEDRTTEFNVGINCNCLQTFTILSFKYDGIRCEIGEYFGEKKDYFWVRISAIEA